MRPVQPWVPERAAPFGAALVLVCALLAAQLLGLMHGVLHPAAGPWEHPRHEHTLPAHEHGAQDARHVAPAVGWMADLLAQHEAGDATCLLLDQLGHSDVMPAVAVQPTPLPTACGTRDFIPLLVQPRAATPYQARAPPVVCTT